MQGRAGDSADEVARRAREKAERLLRRAEAFERGAEGERVVSALLNRLPAQWFVLDDLHWPGRDRANIDHVVVGPTGLFVIDAKNWNGKITISKGTLRQNGYSRKNTTDGAVRAAQAISSVLPSLDARLVVPVLCFVGDPPTSGNVDGVVICGSASLLDVLQSRPPVLSSSQCEFVRFDLDMSTGNARQNVTRRSAQVSSNRSAVRSPRPRNTARIPVFARAFLSFLAWWLGCVVAFAILYPLTKDHGNVVGLGELVVGALCGTLVWRRLKPKNVST